MRIHRLVDPKLGKKIDQAQADMAKYLKTAKISPKVCLLFSFNASFFLLILFFIAQVVLNNETLKTAIAYFIAEADLPFSVVERKSFQNLVRLLNKQAVLLMNQLSRQSIATHLTQIHIQAQEKLKINLLEKQKSISFTQNALTSPNVTDFMAVTAHFINDDFKMVNLTIAIPHVQGTLSFGSLSFFIFILIFLYSRQSLWKDIR